MQIHSLTAQHAFIYRVIFIPFYSNAILRIFIDNNTAAYSAIATNCCSFASAQKRSFSKIVYGIFVIQLAGFIKILPGYISLNVYAATVSVSSTGLTNFVSAVLFIANR